MRPNEKILSFFVVFLLLTSQSHGQFYYYGDTDGQRNPPTTQPLPQYARNIPYYRPGVVPYNYAQMQAYQEYYDDLVTEERREFEERQDRINDVFQYLSQYPGETGTIGNILATSHSMLLVNHGLKYGYDKETFKNIFTQLVNFPLCANFLDTNLNPGGSYIVSTVLQNICQDLFYLIYEPLSTLFLETMGIL